MFLHLTDNGVVWPVHCSGIFFVYSVHCLSKHVLVIMSAVFISNSLWSQWQVHWFLESVSQYILVFVCVHTSVYLYSLDLHVNALVWTTCAYHCPIKLLCFQMCQHELSNAVLRIVYKIVTTTVCITSRYIIALGSVVSLWVFFNVLI